jgi:hypothetical protein
MYVSEAAFHEALELFHCHPWRESPRSPEWWEDQAEAETAAREEDERDCWWTVDPPPSFVLPWLEFARVFAECVPPMPPDDEAVVRRGLEALGLLPESEAGAQVFLAFFGKKGE